MVYFRFWLILLKNSVLAVNEKILAPQADLVNLDGGIDFSCKLTARQLTLAGTRMVLHILSEWYLAENQRFGILEFFNRIGCKRTFGELKTALRIVAVLCPTNCYLPAFTSD